MVLRRRATLLLAVAASSSLPAWGQGVGARQPLRIGVLLSMTGPAVSIGIPQRNALALLPGTAGGRPVEYMVMDDGSDPTRAVANLRKLAAEAEVDAVLGPCTSPGALAERFARTDTSVLSQVLNVIAAQPDAVLVAGAGTPVVLPVHTLRERGYKRPIWQAHGAASSEFLKLGGPEVEGVMLPAAPVLVAAQLPDSHPSKAVALEFTRRYEAAHGPGSVSAFAAQGYDAGVLVLAAAERALGRAQPGTRAFRAALRDEIEATRDFATTQGVVTMTPEDHNGLDERARVIIRVDGGAWRLVE